MERRRLYLLLISVFVLIAVATLLIYPNDLTNIRQPFIPLTNNAITQFNPQIPNYAHFVYILPDPSKNFSLRFSHYLSIYAASFYWKPTTLYIHTNAGEDALDRARSGMSGKWDQLIFNMPNLTIHRVSVPTHAGNGVELGGMEHKSDFVRVKAVEELGGIYIDWDVYALKDAAPLRNSGFRAIGGRELGGQLNSGTFMSKAHGKMIKLWVEGMNAEYDGGWVTHSNKVLTKVAEKLVKEPYEMLIMEREAFAPGSWNKDDGRDLFGIQPDVESNLNGISQGDPLPAYDEDSEPSEWGGLEEKKPFPRDWSKTYLLHAFNPNRWEGDYIEEADNITPRYVLERRSNFARAVYPVASDMYEKGHIMIDD